MERSPEVIEERILDDTPPARDQINGEEQQSSSTRQNSSQETPRGDLDDKETKTSLTGPSVGIEIMALPAWKK